MTLLVLPPFGAFGHGVLAPAEKRFYYKGNYSRGADRGLKAYEVVRFAKVSSVRGRQCPVGEGRRSSGG